MCVPMSVGEFRKSEVEWRYSVSPVFYGQIHTSNLASNIHVKERRQENVGSIGLWAVDESSMMTTSLLTLGSQVSGRIRNGHGAVYSTIPFRGLNMILIGDFHQFEPVGKPHEALYSQPIAGRTERKRLP
ncbi:hypothetical protein PILCRDRAFT_525290 [Piloderma croceum F 1598]|uniref:Uncharacterized protein n=1 Tax=Piloderma croceum (strain F 1598) TaxID=765440 RepID=A0A0C3B2S1_PILCF|nr:hypothetical protein PILCRDRAFT_525290 [Piloderma croceum F 1598]